MIHRWPGALVNQLLDLCCILGRKARLLADVFCGEGEHGVAAGFERVQHVIETPGRKQIGAQIFWTSDDVESALHLSWQPLLANDEVENLLIVTLCRKALYLGLGAIVAAEILDSGESETPAYVAFACTKVKHSVQICIVSDQLKRGVHAHFWFS